eukprot:scaffold1026_cov272-Pinguiococcus_pyrenoidosus.AAC.12
MRSVAPVRPRPAPNSRLDAFRLNLLVQLLGLLPPFAQRHGRHLVYRSFDPPELRGLLCHRRQRAGVAQRRLHFAALGLVGLSFSLLFIWRLDGLVSKDAVKELVRRALSLVHFLSLLGSGSAVRVQLQGPILRRRCVVGLKESPSQRHLLGSAASVASLQVTEPIQRQVKGFSDRIARCGVKGRCVWRQHRDGGWGRFGHREGLSCGHGYWIHASPAGRAAARAWKIETGSSTRTGVSSA